MLVPTAETSTPLSSKAPNGRMHADCQRSEGRAVTLLGTARLGTPEARNPCTLHLSRRPVNLARTVRHSRGERRAPAIVPTPPRSVSMSRRPACPHRAHARAGGNDQGTKYDGQQRAGRPHLAPPAWSAASRGWLWNRRRTSTNLLEHGLHTGNAIWAATRT